ncbi:radical SAM family heme chaperone HemW [Flagellimonas meishanensis]|uniref:radical SAM family heme chaperone HemW n=1 Tax=Flagellimonas meishanensis TaxID=2873264 RepID=UPI001CA6B507|nr:radical SAM family heme chaperone HemW [[Muricauda] meishanensis]
MSGIYIHVPFCKQACHYCDFHFSTQMDKREQMVRMLQKEIELRKDELQHHEVETIYFGGGTPSVLNLDEIKVLIATVYEHYKVVDNPEITLEANPDDLVSSRTQSSNVFQGYGKVGINRLSIGIQSFFDEDLKFMNRAHNAIEAEKCIIGAKEHFENISIDLIYGVPGMDNDRWKANIGKALKFQLPHISSYALTVEPRTALKKFIEKGIVPDVDDAQAERQFHILLEMLEKDGYVNYEISNFGKPGFFSKNNTSYWQGKTYIGIGPSAHSFDGTQRGWNVRNNIKYIKTLEKGELPIEKESLSITDQYNEYVMTGLRTIWGVSKEQVRDRFGKQYLNYLNVQSQRFLDAHLLFEDEGRLLATKRGKFLVDGIASDLFMLNLGQ